MKDKLIERKGIRARCNYAFTVLLIVGLIGCSDSSSTGDIDDSEDDSNPITPDASSAPACDSLDTSVFCVSIDDAESVLYAHTDDTESPLFANPFITSRFDTGGGITLAEVRFDITPTSFIKAASVIFSGITTGTYVMDGSNNFAVYTLAADQFWTFIPGFSSGSIVVTYYGDVGDFIRGTYTATLCDSINASANASDCSDTTYLIDIEGNFNTKRDADI